MVQQSNTLPNTHISVYLLRPKKHTLTNLKSLPSFSHARLVDHLALEGMEFRFSSLLSAILRLSRDLSVEETGVHGENHRPTPGHWQLSYMPQPGFEPGQRWATASSQWQHLWPHGNQGRPSHRRGSTPWTSIEWWCKASIVTSWVVLIYDVQYDVDKIWIVYPCCCLYFALKVHWAPPPSSAKSASASSDRFTTKPGVKYT